MRNPEYDRFGPWVIEISEEDPPPPLFVPHLTREEEPLLSVKIPRKIERRKAHPGMNLYDYMVSLYSDDLVILQREGDAVRSFTFGYSDISFMRFGEELLKGTLHLGVSGDDFELNFSTVSSALMQSLADQIRERYTVETGALPAVGEAAVDLEGLSYYFNGMLKKGRVKEPQVELLAVQTNNPLGAYEEGLLRRFAYGIAGKTLLESMHQSDGRELRIVRRARDYNYHWQTVYGKEIVYLPLENINGVSWQQDATHAAVSRLVLDTTAGQLEFAFMNDNPGIESYDRFLTAVAGTEKQKTENRKQKT